jgi:aspartate kinase
MIFMRQGYGSNAVNLNKKTSMNVFKFGGASVIDANAVKNIGVILKKYEEPLVVVVSAMGKTTNALERVLNAYVSDDREKARAELDQVRDYHMSVAGDLISNTDHANDRATAILLVIRSYR